MRKIVSIICITALIGLMYFIITLMEQMISNQNEIVKNQETIITGMQNMYDWLVEEMNNIEITIEYEN